ncbi:yippee-like protein [Schizosaccharomyces japonicus yFS275]|uniref:Protein yippee-like n=1 Tax=Schizosaccharomyces japonicus (strain yFS275 / FY16936) TaxID=402676 RepID=B6JZG4_SCHJY|nr:yippee-like protein [Schizosaccharomyces japonicus yFS275]EEB06932.1 yippee-like protein [Schizosaccharomyces japonicus yFS275]
MGRSYRTYLSRKFFVCNSCNTHVALFAHLRSKDYYGAFGAAALFEQLFNGIALGKEKEEMRTGRYVVRRILCCHCHSNIGWRYERAYEPSQKIKENLYILELERVSIRCEE